MWQQRESFKSMIQSVLDPSDSDDGSCHLAVVLDGSWGKGSDLAVVLDRYVAHSSGCREVATANAEEVGLVAKALRHLCPLPTIQALLDAGANPDLPALSGRWGQTQHYAINMACDFPEIMSALIGAGADLSLRNGEQRSPLGHALRDAKYMDEDGGSLNDPVLQLLQAGADPNAPARQIQQPRDEVLGGGVDFLESHQPIHTQWLFEHGANLSLRAPDDRTALHCPLTPEALRMGLAAGLNPNARDAQGNTPLHYQKSAEGVAALITAGANPNAINAKGLSALQCVKTEEAKEALAAAGPHARPVDLAEKLYAAVSSGSAGKVKKCLEQGADPNDFYNKEPILFAAVRSPEKFNPKVIEVLLDAGADPSIGRGFMGGFVGFLALNDHERIPALIARIAPQSDLHQQDEYGMTVLGAVALHMNVRCRDKNKPDPRVVMCQALLEAGARPTPSDFKVAPTLAIRTLFKRAIEPASHIARVKLATP